MSDKKSRLSSSELKKVLGIPALITSIAIAIITMIVNQFGDHISDQYQRGNVKIALCDFSGQPSFRYLPDAIVDSNGNYVNELPIFTSNTGYIEPKVTTIIENPSEGTMVYHYEIHVTYTPIVFANYDNVILWEGGDMPGDLNINYLVANLSDKSTTVRPEPFDSEKYFSDGVIEQLNGHALKIDAKDQNQDELFFNTTRQGLYEVQIVLKYQNGEKAISKTHPETFRFIYLEIPYEEIYPEAVINFEPREYELT